MAKKNARQLQPTAADPKQHHVAYTRALAKAHQQLEELLARAGHIRNANTAGVRWMTNVIARRLATAVLAKVP
jgi:hypothetical protein